MKTKSINSNRSFGVVFFVVFLAIALWPFRGDFSQIKFLPLCFSFAFLILGLMNSKLLTPLSKLWLKFGELLGRIISPIVMFFLYFIFITPMAVIIRLFGKDLLKIKLGKIPSYWIRREKNIGSMKKQF